MENNELFKQIRDTVEKWRPENERRFRERKKLIRKYGESSPEFTEWERKNKGESLSRSTRNDQSTSRLGG